MRRAPEANKRKRRLSHGYTSMTDSGNGVYCYFQRSAKLVELYLPRMLFDWNSYASGRYFTRVDSGTCMMENTWDYLWPLSVSGCMKEIAIGPSRYFLSTSHISIAQPSPSGCVERSLVGNIYPIQTSCLCWGFPFPQTRTPSTLLPSGCPTET